MANPGRFCCKSKATVYENCFGAWDYEDDDWQSLNYIPSLLKAKLTDIGYRYEEVIQNWREKEWMILDNRGDNPRHSLGKSRTRLISIRRTAIREVVRDEIFLVHPQSPFAIPSHEDNPLPALAQACA